jgi:hypothetical protein
MPLGQSSSSDRPVLTGSAMEHHSAVDSAASPVVPHPQFAEVAQV